MSQVMMLMCLSVAVKYKDVAHLCKLQTRGIIGTAGKFGGNIILHLYFVKLRINYLFLLVVLVKS